MTLGREKVGNHPEPTFEQRGLDCLLEAAEAARNNDALALRFALARARCFLPADDLEALRMEHNLSFVLSPQLTDAQRDNVAAGRRRYSFADV